MSIIRGVAEKNKPCKSCRSHENKNIRNLWCINKVIFIPITTPINPKKEIYLFTDPLSKLILFLYTR